MMYLQIAFTYYLCGGFTAQEVRCHFLTNVSWTNSQGLEMIKVAVRQFSQSTPVFLP
jgi:hypothetical protein